MIKFINSIGLQLTNIQGNSFNGKHNKNTTISYDYKDIVSDYKKAIKLDENFYLAYFNIANLNIKAGNYDAAIKNYEKAISIEPDFAEAWYNKALLQIYLKQNDTACQSLSKAGELGLKKAYRVIERYCK